MTVKGTEGIGLAYDNISTYYDELYNNGARTKNRSISVVKNRSSETESVYELGCGTGVVLEGYSDDYVIGGIDLSPGMIELAKRKLPEADLSVGDMSEMPNDRPWDVVISLFGAMNHSLDFDHWLRTFRRIHECLSDGGTFVLELQTCNYYKSIANSGMKIRPIGDSYYSVGYGDLEDGVIDCCSNFFKGDGSNIYSLTKSSFKKRCVDGELVMDELQDIFSDVRLEMECGITSADTIGSELYICTK
jgi:ubiquinone/menaquinone biosynthesis C-methylase UbiE